MDRQLTRRQKSCRKLRKRCLRAKLRSDSQSVLYITRSRHAASTQAQMHFARSTTRSGTGPNWSLGARKLRARAFLRAQQVERLGLFERQQLFWNRRIGAADKQSAQGAAGMGRSAASPTERSAQAYARKNKKTLTPRHRKSAWETRTRQEPNLGYTHCASRAEKSARARGLGADALCLPVASRTRTPAGGRGRFRNRSAALRTAVDRVACAGQRRTLPGRLELPTLRLTASRSNQLS